MNHRDANQTYISDDLFNERQPTGTLSDLEIFVRYFVATAKIIADIVMICLLQKFKILRTWENSLVMHWAIMDLCHIISYLIDANNLLPSVIIRSIPCVVESIISTTFLSTVIFAEAILVGFVILNCQCFVLKNHENVFKRYFIFSVFLLCLLEYVLEFLRCHYLSWFDNSLVVIHTILFFSIIINIFLKKIINYDHRVIQTNYILYISNAAIFPVIPILVYHYLLTYCQDYEGFIKFVEATFFIAYLILLSNSLIIVVILYNFCKDFRTLILFVFKKIMVGSEKSKNEIDPKV